MLVASTIEFCKSENKDFSILTETHIKHDQIHHIRNNWLGPIFFSPGDSHKKGLLVLYHLGLECVTEVDTDPKQKFLCFKVSPYNDRVLCVYATLGHNIREHQTRGHFFVGLQNYMENESKRNEDKIRLYL